MIKTRIKKKRSKYESFEAENMKKTENFLTELRAIKWRKLKFHHFL